MALPLFLLHARCPPSGDASVLCVAPSVPDPFWYPSPLRMPNGPRNAWERALWDVQAQPYPGTECSSIDTLFRYCAAFALLAHRKSLDPSAANRLDVWLCELDRIIVPMLPLRHLGAWRTSRGIAWLHAIATYWTPWEGTWVCSQALSSKDTPTLLQGAYFTTTHASTTPPLEGMWWDTGDTDAFCLEQWAFHGVHWLRRVWYCRWDDSEEHWISTYEEDMVSHTTRRNTLRNVLAKNHGLYWNRIPASSRVPSLLDLALTTDQFDNAIVAHLVGILQPGAERIQQVLMLARTMGSSLEEVLRELNNEQMDATEGGLPDEF